MAILLYAIFAAVLSLIDGFVGKLFLSDVLPTWGYWDFFGVAVFGSAIVGSALILKD